MPMHNEVLRERIRRMPKTGTWYCRLFSLPGGSVFTQGRPMEKTFWMLAALDETDCVVLTVTADEKEPIGELEESLAEALLSVDRCPKAISADSKACAALLREFCKEAVIDLTVKPQEASLPERGVVELLSNAPDTITIHDSFCEILLQLRDEELLRMPRDLVETLIRMEGSGTVPHVLAVRMRRLFENL